MALDLVKEHFTDSVGGFVKIKEKKNEEIAKNHIAVFSTHFYHILTCIYTVFSHDKAHILKFRTLAFF